MADFNKTTCVLDFELPVPGKVCGCSKNTHLFFNLFKASQDQMKTQLFKIYKDKIPTHVRLYIEHLLATQQPQERSGEEDHVPAGNAINESLEQQMHYGQAPTTSPVETPIVLVPVCHFKASQTIRNEHVETFTINQERRGKGNTERYFAKISMLKQLGITCTRCGSCGAHRTANCKKSKEELECSDCKSRGRPYLGHVNKTCFDRLGLPRTRKK